MTKKTELENAKVALKELELNFAILDLVRSDLSNYVSQIDTGVWDPNGDVIPDEGPISRATADIIGVEIPDDYSSPEQFTDSAVQEAAKAAVASIEKEIVDVDEQMANMEIEIADLAQQAAAEVSAPGSTTVKPTIKPANPTVVMQKRKASDEIRLFMTYLLFLALLIVLVRALSKSN